MKKKYILLIIVGILLIGSLFVFAFSSNETITNIKNKVLSNFDSYTLAGEGEILKGLPLNSHSSFTDTYQKNTKVTINGTEKWENTFLFDVQEVNRKLIASNESGLFYELNLKVSRTGFGDWLINNSGTELDKGLIISSFATQNKYRGKEFGKDISQLATTDLVDDLTNPPITATKGMLLSYDLGDFDLIKNEEEIINVVVGFKTGGAWNVDGVKLKLGHSSTAWALETSISQGSGNIFGLALSNISLALSNDYFITQVYDIAGFSWVANVSNPLVGANDIDFSEDGGLLFLGYDLNVSVINTTTWVEIINLVHSEIFFIDGSPCNDMFMYGGVDDNVYLRNQTDYSLLFTFKNSTANVRDGEFSPGCDLLCYTGDDNNVYIHNTTDYSLVDTLTDSGAANFFCGFNNNHLAFGGADITGYTYNYSGEAFTYNVDLSSHSGDITSGEFSRDNNWLSLGLGDGNVSNYQTSDFSLNISLNNSREKIPCVRYSPNSSLLAYGSWDNYGYVHNVPTIDVTPTANIVYPINDTTYDYVVSNLTYTTDGDNCWYSFDAGVTNSSTQVAGTNWTGLTASADSNTWHLYCNNSANLIGSDSVTFVVNISVTTELITPLVNETIPTTSANFTFNSTPNNVDLTFVTMYIWNSSNDEIYANTTTLSGTSEVTTSHNVTNLADGNYSWNALTNATSNLIDWDVNRTFYINTIPNISFQSPTNANGTNLSINTFIAKVTVTETHFSNLTFNLYNSSRDLYNSTIYTDSTRIINWTVADDGTYYYNVTIWTTTNQQNSTETRGVIIDTTAPTGDFLSPLNGTIINDGYATSTYANITLNVSGADEHLSNCWIYNLTANVSLTCGDNFSMMYPYNTYLNESYTFYYYINDTFGNIRTASTTATWIYDIINTSITYDASVYETASEQFIINTTYDDIRWNDFVVNLIYNGTSYPTSSSGTGTNLSSNRTISIPILMPEGSVGKNISFIWEFILTNNSGATYYNSTSLNQFVNPLNLSTSPMNYSVLNFSTWNEENLTRELQYDFYGTFIYWVGDGTTYKNISISNTNINETIIYINENLTYYTNAHIQYEKSSFIKRSYFLRNASLTETLQHIKLFLLLEASSTSFIIEVIDESRFPVEDAYVYIQRYYPGTGSFETVEISQTDETGTTIGHFEEETEDYKVIITLDGQTVYESGQQRMICKETPCTATFQIGSVGTTQWQDFGDVSNLVHSLNFNPSTNLWTYSYIDTSGSAQYGRLHVYSKRGDYSTTICNESSTSAAATLTCNVTGNTGTIYAGSYISRSPEILLELKTAIVEGLKDIFGLEGLFLAMIALMVLGFAGLWNPAVGIILEVIGIIFLNVLGIASFGATAIVGIVLIGLILLWQLRT